MLHNLARDFICLGFCLEAIAVCHGLTLTSILLQDHPTNVKVLTECVRHAGGLLATAARQYHKTTTKQEWGAQRRANGNIFAHRYDDLLNLVTGLRNTHKIIDNPTHKLLSQLYPLYKQAKSDETNPVEALQAAVPVGTFTGVAFIAGILGFLSKR